jgi:hypothetical protein
MTLRERDGFVVVVCSDADGRRNDDHAGSRLSVLIECTPMLPSVRAESSATASGIP